MTNPNFFIEIIFIYIIDLSSHPYIGKFIFIEIALKKDRTSSDWLVDQKNCYLWHTLPLYHRYRSQYRVSELYFWHFILKNDFSSDFFLIICQTIMTSFTVSTLQSSELPTNSTTRLLQLVDFSKRSENFIFIALS